MRQYKRNAVILMLAVTTIFLFQNCSNEQFGTESGASLNPSTTGAGNNASGFNQNGGGSGSGGSTPPAITNIAAGMVVEDKSIGDSTIVTRLTQKIYNAKSGLRGCTALITNYNLYCVNDSDFIPITSAMAWGAGSYDATLDVYSVDTEISAKQWPMTTYFTRYIASDGSRKEFIFTPTQSSMPKPARLQWVYTSPKACFGPSSPPAPIGEACASIGETRTGECGTATCQYK